MKGGFLLLAVFLVLFIAIMTGICLFRVQIQMKEVNQRRDVGQAFYAAESGMERAISQLKQSIGFGGWGQDQSLTYVNGEESQTVGNYTATIRPGKLFRGVLPTVWVRSEGHNVVPEGGEEQTRVLVARLSVQNPAAYFIFTLQDLQIQSGAVIDGDSLAQNVNFQIDGSLPPAQRLITINGNLSYLLSVSGEKSPNVVIKGAVFKSPAVNFPSVDTNFYRQNTERGVGNYVIGNYTISGDISPASLNSLNGCLYATGDVHVQGEVTQSVLIVAGGNIYIDGDITARAKNPDDPKPQIGLFARGDVNIASIAPSTLKIENAFILADGGLFQALGTVAKDSLTFSGAMAVRGRRNETSAILLSVYKNRNYSYSTDLRDNYSIPLGPLAIVSVLKWYEADPKAPFPPPG